MQLKPGAQVRHPSTQTVFSQNVARWLWHEWGWTQPFVITSGDDGIHSTKSKHYTGDAWDLRARHLDRHQRERFAAELRTRLGQDFDVVVHDEKPNREHIHVEYDPKGPARV